METNAFLILLPLMLLLLFSEPIYRQWRMRQPPDFNEPALDSLLANLKWTDVDSVSTPGSTSVNVTFKSFDPNTVSSGELVQMGLSSSLANRVARYREKGGAFRKAEDLLKIYGFDSAWFNRAKPWMSVTLKSVRQKDEGLTKARFSPKKADVVKIIDINMADSIQLLSVYGIGPALSKRIRTFRDRLGGFVSMDQLEEVYGLDSSVVRQIKIKFTVSEGFAPKKMNLNSVTQTELSAHPYLKRNEAQAILSYRLQHGNFQSVDQLHDVKSLTIEVVKKLSPYLTIE